MVSVKLRSAPPALQIVPATNIPILRVSGDVGQTNVIEASQVLDSDFWWPVASGSLTNGTFNHIHSGATNFRQLFFRAAWVRRNRR